MKLSAKQLTMLRDFHRDLEATDIADFGDGTLAWANRGSTRSVAKGFTTTPGLP